MVGADAMIETSAQEMCLNHPQTIPLPVPWSGGKICPRKPALVPIVGERWSREMYLRRSVPFRWCRTGQ